jgi:iron complex transport system substrate-binding protein
MRFLWSNILLVLIAETAVISGVTAQNLKTCVTGDVDPNKDYFPDKVETEFALFFSVEYHNTYKVLTNTEDNVKYVLYQCGTEPPTGVSANHTLAVPLQNGVALSTTAHLPFFELLGLRDEIKAYLGDPQWISSPCMQDRLDSGDAILVMDPYAEGEIDGLYAKTSSDLVIIHNPIYGYDLANHTNIAVSEWLERDSHKIAEYIKFFAVLFNEEAKANQEFQGMVDRYQCTQKNAERVISDGGVIPKVVFAEFSTYCGGWSIGSCPNFYCDLVTDCASEMLEDPQTGSIKNPDCGPDSAFMTTAEMVAFAKDADVWIYPSHGDYPFDSAYAEFGEQLDQLKAVQNKNVYDTVLSGLYVWFEHRLVEYGKWGVAIPLFELFFPHCLHPIAL